MAITGRRFIATIGVIGVLGSAALRVFHDPPWTAGMTYGLYAPEIEDGRQFSWTTGRASFFIPASASSVTIELGGHDMYDVTVTVAIDGRPADRVSVGNEWTTVELRTDTRDTSRRYRRIDLICNRIIGTDFQRGVKVRWRIRQ
jgi:hypothetical protein